MVTLAEVARHAGVSLATASRALHGTRKVNEALREKVRRSADVLGYEPDPVARSLASGASNVIGVIVHDLVDPYFAAVADGAMAAADRHGLIVTVGTTRRDPEREVALVSALRAQRARAIILAGSRSAEDSPELPGELERYRAAGGRVATVGQPLPGLPAVAPANRAGAAALAGALAELGHRRFAILAGPAGLATARDRTEAFSAELAARGLPAPLLLHGPFDRDGGHTAALAALDHGGDDRPTCLFAVNDVMAVGAVAALREREVRVPEDLSVAGFDDIVTLRDLVPSLTTVRLPLRELGERALDLALGAEGAPVVEVAAQVVLRDSTRRIG